MPRPRALPTYALVTPVRDEIEHLPRTAEAVLGQDHPPLQWVIVDDGSTDGTRAFAERLAAEHDWITVVDSGQQHGRARGAPIVRAFNRGVRELRTRPDITVKLDADLQFAAHYFAWVAQVFVDDPRAGVVGGTTLVHDGTRWRQEVGKQTSVNGTAKAYRTDCLDSIGGLPESMGWDGIDEFSARARDWNIHVLPELTVLHFRWRGRRQRWWTARWEEGRANHFMAYRADFLLVRVAYRMLVERPLVISGIVVLLGYLSAAVRRRPQIADPGARRILRAEQGMRLRRLARGSLDLPTAPPPGGGPAFTATARTPEDVADPA